MEEGSFGEWPTFVHKSLMVIKGRRSRAGKGEGREKNWSEKDEPTRKSSSRNNVFEKICVRGNGLWIPGAGSVGGCGPEAV